MICMNRRPPPCPPRTLRRPPRGAALLTAMIIVTVIATLSAGMVWQQWQAVQVEAAERAQAQSQWVLNGALDWARLILREDARSSADVDHLGEPWAVPLAESKLSTFLAADRDRTDDAPEAFLSGAIRDLQARYNLRNLVRDGQVQEAEVAALARLCQTLGLADDLAMQIAQALQRGTPATSAVVTGNETAAPAPVLPPGVDDLGWLGLDARSVTRLQAYVTLLPVATPVNLNTASREVLAAVLAGVDLASAERLVQARQRNPLRSLAAAQALLDNPLVTLDPQRVSVSTRFFEVDGVLRLDDLVVAQRSLLERQAPSREVRMLRRQRLLPEALAAAATADQRAAAR